ncbi:glycosyltransferase [Desulfurivibrio alkaliphilus]|uniref:Glycosyl transferase group 1 n=1 Tax=Desulfurivibrio alkaliphilus (strain DSM 19089 / UNIQEM U267 / AHT2) TaxID=589865 RepID=D6Z2L6_DESAT|nr:glycosyltransferase [Desulfurivibrio alkaliphilus]ADH85791.1 glycosyl transferase group 1 [Desulfurivibrio alkaliphilus AHT 2]
MGKHNLPLTAAAETPDIVLFGIFRSWGGTYRRLLNQIHVWLAMGLRVELVTFRDGEMFYPEEVPPAVRLVHLGTSHRLPTILALWRYLRRRRPPVILSVNHISNMVLARTGYLPGLRTRRYLSVPNTFGQSEKRADSPRKRERKFREIRKVYPCSHGVIAVSDGVRDDLRDNVGLTGVHIERIYSGSVAPGNLARAKEPVEHPWLVNKELPVVLSVGRLVPQKDYAMLLRAFARVVRQRPARLLILGEGRERPTLENLAEELGISQWVDMPGFAGNPYAYMARADVFALSSRWEGLVNVVMEALGVGTPVVSTDCPSGPREILADGRYGILVPMQDDRAMAAGILKVLRGEAPQFDYAEAVRPFMAETAARAYLDFFGLSPRCKPAESERAVP